MPKAINKKGGEAALLKDIPAEAKSIWGDDKSGTELSSGFPEALDMADYIGTVFKLEYKSTSTFQYEFKGKETTGTSHTFRLIATQNPTLQKHVGQDIAIYGRGLLNYFIAGDKKRGVKALEEGDVIGLVCTGKTEMKNGNTPYQFRMKYFNKK